MSERRCSVAKAKTKPKSDVAIQAGMIRWDPSQLAFFRDTARVQVVNWHRQKGKDFVASAKAVDHALATGQDWNIVSLTQRQADATFAKCKQHARAVREVWKLKGLPVPSGEDSFSEYGSEQYDKWIRHAFHFTAHKITFPNGGSVTSLPGRDPDTLAGLTGNVIFTEFGLFPGGGYDHWSVVFPIATRGGFKVIVISTPRGKNTKFYELWRNEEGYYSIHTCDIYRSVHEDGFQLYDAQSNPFPITTKEERDFSIETYRKIYNSPSTWAREFGCEFTGDLSSLITWAEIERAAALGTGLPFDYLHCENDADYDLGAIFTEVKAEIRRGGRVEIGWDVARHGHLSAIPFNFASIGKPKHLRFLATLKGCSFEFQRGIIEHLMKLQAWSVGSGDATGLGMESNEVLERRYPDRWIPFTFTGAGKRDAASSLSTAFSDGTQTLPALNGKYKFIATDLYAIQKDDTGAMLMLDETENPLLADSHCDIAWGLALCRRAGAAKQIRQSKIIRYKPVGV